MNKSGPFTISKCFFGSWVLALSIFLTISSSSEMFQNTTPSETSVRHLVYLLENAILNLGEGQEQMCWLIDFTGFTMKTNVSVKIAADVINVLQNHYPERLAVSLLYNPPRFFQAFWKVLSHPNHL